MDKIRDGAKTSKQTNKQKIIALHKTEKREQTLWTRLATQLVFCALIDLNFLPKRKHLVTRVGGGNK